MSEYLCWIHHVAQPSERFEAVVSDARGEAGDERGHRRKERRRHVRGRARLCPHLTQRGEERGGGGALARVARPRVGDDAGRSRGGRRHLGAQVRLQHVLHHVLHLRRETASVSATRGAPSLSGAARHCEDAGRGRAGRGGARRGAAGQRGACLVAVVGARRGAAGQRGACLVAVVGARRGAAGQRGACLVAVVGALGGEHLVERHPERVHVRGVRVPACPARRRAAAGSAPRAPRAGMATRAPRAGPHPPPSLLFSLTCSLL